MHACVSCCYGQALGWVLALQGGPGSASVCTACCGRDLIGTYVRVRLLREQAFHAVADPCCLRGVAGQGKA